MSRKIFLSFLGSTNYSVCHYVKDSYKSKSVRYIQEATLEYLKADIWAANSKAFVLVTDGERGSLRINWKDDGHKVYGKKEIIKQPGLDSRLKKMQLPFDLEPIRIKDGNSEEEIWEIFETIYKLLKENDELYIDITHGFRYLPMLSIVLANYGKLLKNIRVKSITYGNYETKNDKDEAPIIELTSFSQLQDWTNAANLFVKHGNLDGLAYLTKQEALPILKVSQGKDKTAFELRKLSDSLSEISLALKSNNAPDINSGILFAKFKQSMENLEGNLIKPLSPILEQIENKLSPFSIFEDVTNGLKAVDFCIDSGLIQQAFTMIQESIISIVLDSEDLDVKNVDYRNIVSGSFKIHKEKHPVKRWKGKNFQNQYLTTKLLGNEILVKLSSSYNSLTDKRNVINHAGFNEKSSTKVFRNLEKDIIDLNNRIKEKFEFIQKL